MSQMMKLALFATSALQMHSIALVNKSSNDINSLDETLQTLNDLESKLNHALKKQPYDEVPALQKMHINEFKNNQSDFPMAISSLEVKSKQNQKISEKMEQATKLIKSFQKLVDDSESKEKEENINPVQSAVTPLTPNSGADSLQKTNNLNFENTNINGLFKDVYSKGGVVEDMYKLIESQKQQLVSDKEMLKSFGDKIKLNENILSQNVKIMSKESKILKSTSDKLYSTLNPTQDTDSTVQKPSETGEGKEDGNNDDEEEEDEVGEEQEEVEESKEQEEVEESKEKEEDEQEEKKEEDEESKEQEKKPETPARFKALKSKQNRGNLKTKSKKIEMSEIKSIIKKLNMIQNSFGEI